MFGVCIAARAVSLEQQRPAATTPSAALSRVANDAAEAVEVPAATHEAQVDYLQYAVSALLESLQAQPA